MSSGSIIAVSFLIIFSIQCAWADDVEAELKELEAKLIYESALKLIAKEEYDRAVRRFDRIISEYPGTSYAMLAATRKSEIPTLRRMPPPISRISRASLVGFGTLFSSWSAYGILTLAEVKEAEAYGCGCIVGPLGGLGGSLKLTQNIKLSDGQASLINFSGAWGIWQAVGSAIIADMSYEGIVGASMAGGIIGIVLSSAIVRNREIAAGDATMINFGGIWGTWLALCGAMAANMEDSDNVLASAMMGGNVGFLTMSALSPKLKMSRARARLINIGGIIGALYGLGTGVLFDVKSERNFWGIMAISSILGLSAGVYFTRDYDIEKGYFAEGAFSP